MRNEDIYLDSDITDNQLAPQTSEAVYRFIRDFGEVFAKTVKEELVVPSDLYLMNNGSLKGGRKTKKIISYRYLWRGSEAQCCALRRINQSGYVHPDPDCIDLINRHLGGELIVAADSRQLECLNSIQSLAGVSPLFHA